MNPNFDLAVVLDDTPKELIHLLIDLITISSHTVRGSQVLIPQRVKAEQGKRDNW